jgi:hypothetical protein
VRLTFYSRMYWSSWDFGFGAARMNPKWWTVRLFVGPWYGQVSIRLRGEMCYDR